MYFILNSNNVLYNKLLTFFTVSLTLVNLSDCVFQSDPPFYSQLYAKIPLVRSIVIDEVGDILVSTQKSESKLYFLYETLEELNGSIQIVQGLLFDGQGLNLDHGLAYRSGYLYASSSSTVYRWPYTPGQRKALDNSLMEIVIAQIPTQEGQGHFTRTIIFDKEGLLYVQVGSFGDVDLDSSWARISRFNITDKFPLGGIRYSDGEVFAKGVRNSVGLAFDSFGILWGLDNGATAPFREDLGGDISKGNPADELNRFDHPPGKNNYGYPYCFTSYLLENYTQNSQLVWEDFMSEYSDAWCEDGDNNQAPIMALPAHTAPLGIEFYDKDEACDRIKGSFHCSALKDAFIAFHNKEFLDEPTFWGNRIVWLPFDNEGNNPTGEMKPVIYEKGMETGDCEGSCARPVNAVFDQRGHLIVSCDWNGEIYRVTHGSPPPPIKSNKILY